MVNSSLVSTCIVTVKWTVICRKPKGQIIDLRDTDKSLYFSITKFNIVLSFSDQVCFLINIFGKLPFSRKSDRKKEKRVRFLSCMSRILP